MPGDAGRTRPGPWLLGLWISIFNLKAKRFSPGEVMAKKNKLWGLLGGLALLLLNYPLLHIANTDVLVAGMPGLALYVFSVWLLAIAGLFLLARRGGAGDRKNGEHS